METLLWRDIAQFYHADLRNLAGPYDRSYGMDMRRYASVIGIWMRLATDKIHALFPDTDRPFEHEHDIAFVPLIAFLGARVPPDARERLLAFQGERQIEHVISDSPRRVATAWLGKDRMLGGEFTSRTAPQSTQLHPATIHWRIDAEQIGWVRLFYLEPVDARASRDRLEIVTTSEIAFLVHAPGAPIEQIARENWQLPGLSVRVETNAEAMDVRPLCHSERSEESRNRENEMLHCVQHDTLDGCDYFEIRYIVASDQPIACALNCESG